MSDSSDPDYALRRELRARSRDSALRTLFLTNGGSAVALLAFLQTIWGPGGSDFIPWIIAALAILAVSLPVIGWAYYNEAEISLEYDRWRLADTAARTSSPASTAEKPKRVNTLERFRIKLIAAAIGLFVLALGSVCVGALINLPPAPPPICPDKEAEDMSNAELLRCLGVETE